MEIELKYIFAITTNGNKTCNSYFTKVYKLAVLNRNIIIMQQYAITNNLGEWPPNPFGTINNIQPTSKLMFDNMIKLLKIGHGFKLSIKLNTSRYNLWSYSIQTHSLVFIRLRIDPLKLIYL
jgi:hypothetical protein